MTSSPTFTIATQSITSTNETTKENTTATIPARFDPKKIVTNQPKSSFFKLLVGVLNPELRQHFVAVDLNDRDLHDISRAYLRANMACLVEASS